MPRVGAWRWRTEYGTARAVSSDKHEQRVLQLLERSRILLDTETDGVDRGRRLRLVQVGWGDEAWLIDPLSKRGRRLIATICRDKRVGIVAHNAAFDLMTLAIWRWGTDDYERHYRWVEYMAASGRVRDTMVAAQVAWHQKRSPSLAWLASRFGVHNAYTEEWADECERLGLSGDQKFASMPSDNPFWLRYSAHDIWQLRAAYEGLRAQGVFKSRLVRSETQCEMLYDIMQHRGMAVDLDYGNAVYSELDERLEKQRAQLARLGVSGENRHDDTRAALEDLGARLSVQTPTGQFSVAKVVLENIKRPKRAARLCRLILETRSTSHDHGMVLSIAKHSDAGRVHPKVWRIGAITGRSACSGPNLQQLNKHAGDPRVRAMLTADEGHVLVTVDYDGFELRTIADLAGDRALVDRLMDGADVHGDLAEQVYGRDYTPRQRDGAKHGVFALLYGGGDSTVADWSGCTLEEAAALRAAWRRTYKSVARVSDQWVKDAKRRGRSVLHNGWEVRVPPHAAYQSVNHHTQGMAAFVFRRGVRQVSRAGLWHLVRMVVHDEFALSVPADQVSELVPRLAAAAEVPSVTGVRGLIYTTSSEIRDGKHWTV